MDREGFEKLVLQLTARTSHPSSWVWNPRASYHIPLFSYLAAQGYRVAIINPLLIQTSQSVP